MTRHLITKTLLAASAFTVLAAAPSAMAAPEHPIKAKVQKSQSFKKVASDRSRNNTRNHRSDRNRSDRNRGDRSRNNRGHNTRNRNRNDRSRSRNYRRSHYGNNRSYNRSYSNLLSRVSSVNYGNRGYYSPYRSNVGISFNIGSPGYSQYRWSQSPYSLYRPTYGSYGGYQTRTTCRRVTVEGWHHGHRELVSVKQCSNPWDGAYIVQGSERAIDCRW